MYHTGFVRFSHWPVLAVIEIGFVAIAENHRTYSYEALSPLSLQQTVSQDTNYIDWSAFGESVGFGDFADQLLESALDFVEGRDKDGNLRINSVMKDFVLGGEEALVLQFDDTSFEVDQLVLSLKEIKVNGLDSFTQLNLANPIGPQTLSNKTAKNVPLCLRGDHTETS